VGKGYSLYETPEIFSNRMQRQLKTGQTAEKAAIRKFDKRKYFFGSIELRKNNNVINNVIKFYTLAHRKAEVNQTGSRDYIY
jgi:hypothetical protein